MKNDLVARLRAEDPETGLRFSIASEAADRIEELENEVNCGNVLYRSLIKEFSEYINDTKKMRTALQKIVKTTPFGKPQEIARAALEGKDD